MNTKNRLLILGVVSAIVLCCSSLSAFSQASNNAYGNNMSIVDSVLVGSTYQYTFAIFSGDVNQDGVIDATDFNVVEADVLNFSAGYIASDINGDGVADASDFNLLEKNVLRFVTVAKP